MILRKYKKVEIFYSYAKKSLPSDGWFQLCFSCDTITANIMKIKDKITCCETIEYLPYICIPCQKILREDSYKYKKFFNRCNRFIEKL